MVDTGASASGPRKPQPLEVHHQRGGSGFIGPASPTSPFDQGDVMPGRLPTLAEGAGHGQLTSEDIGGAQQGYRELYHLLGNTHLCRLVNLVVTKGRADRPAYDGCLAAVLLETLQRNSNSPTGCCGVRYWLCKIPIGKMFCS